MTILETMSAMTDDQIMACIDLCDGHSIFSRDQFLDHGVPEGGIDNFIDEFKSDGTPMGTIFDSKTGKAKDSMVGISGLDFLIKIAGALDVKYEDFIGRGFQARAIKKALREHYMLKNLETT